MTEKLLDHCGPAHEPSPTKLFCYDTSPCSQTKWRGWLKLRVRDAVKAAVEAVVGPLAAR